MAEFVVNTNQLRNCAGQLSGLQSQLDSVAIRLGGLQLGSVLRINAASALIARVGDCKWAASNQSDNLGKLARAMDEIAELYEQYERALCEPQTAEQAAEHAAEIGYQDPRWAEVLNDWLSPIFDIGGIAAEGIIQYIGDGARAIGSTINNVLTWAGAGIGSFFDNFLEFDGNILSPDFLYEFIGQTAIDGAIGWGVGTLATTIATAIIGATPVGWAAVATAAAGTAVVFLGNTICEWITGDSISEWVVDGVRDLGNWVGDQVDRVADGIREGAEAVGDFIGDTANSIREGGQAMWAGLRGLFD